MKKENIILRRFVAVVLVISALAAVFPFIYMVLISLTQKDTLNFDFNFATMSLINYDRVINNFHLMTNLKNSIIVTTSACILNALFSSMAAYAFAKKDFPFRKQIFAVFIATLVIPGQVTMIPVFVIMRSLGLMNTYPALILPIINAFGVFLVRQFMVSVPDDLLDAARIDGCGENRIFFTIVLPLVQPVLVSLTIFTFISSWNDFLWPLVIASKPAVKTLTLAIASLKGSYSTNYGLVMAGSTFTFIVPFLLYIFLQKQFVEGIALSGIKG